MNNILNFENLSDFEKTRHLLMDATFNELRHIVNYVRSLMGPGWCYTYTLDIYGNRGLDKQGLLQYLNTLLNVSRISYHDIFAGYRQLHPFLESNTQRDIYFGEVVVDKNEEILTDNYEGPLPSDVRTKPLEISNPRWMKKDKNKDKDEVALIGETIILMADIENYQEGAEVVFDIFDMSIKPPKKVGTSKGKHSKGLGKGEWVVTDNGADQKLEFEATARGRTSNKKDIALSISKKWGICRGKDKLPITLRPFKILKEGELVHSGTTDNKGQITAPFDYSDEYELQL